MTVESFSNWVYAKSTLHLFVSYLVTFWWRLKYILTSAAKNFGVTEFVNLKDYITNLFSRLVPKPNFYLPVLYARVWSLTYAFDDQMMAEMTDGRVDRRVEYTGNIQAMISAFECVHNVTITSVKILSWSKFLFEQLSVSTFIGVSSGSCWAGWFAKQRW